MESTSPLTAGFNRQNLLRQAREMSERLMRPPV